MRSGIGRPAKRRGLVIFLGLETILAVMVLRSIQPSTFSFLLRQAGVKPRAILASSYDGPNPGQSAPDIALENETGDHTTTIASLQGKPAVLLFGSYT